MSVGIVPDTKPIDPCESLMAVTGIGPAIGRDMPKVGVGVMLDASKIQGQLAGLARKLVHGDSDEYSLPQSSYSWDKMHVALSQPLTPENVAQIQGAFIVPHMDTAGLYVTHCQNVHDHLKELFPVQEFLSFLGPKQVQPDDLSVFEFWSQYNVLNAPLDVFKLMGSAALLTPQVDAMREIYPSLSKAIDTAIYSAIAQAGTVASFQLPQMAEQGIGVWMDRKTVAYDPDYGKVRKPSGPQKAAPNKAGGNALQTQNSKALNP